MGLYVGGRHDFAPNLPIDNHLWERTGPWIDTALVRPGTAPILGMPPGRFLQTDTGFVPGTWFDYHGQGVQIRGPVARPGIDALHYLQLAPDAPFGSRLLQAGTMWGIAFQSGGLIVVPPPPVIRSITPEAAPEGTVAVIDGENFGGTSLPIVLFNGRMATGLTVESPTRLRATVPPEISTVLEVRVITLGAWRGSDQ